MGARRMGAVLRKGVGVALAVAGAVLLIRGVPLYLWPLILGVLLIWGGWQLYIYGCYY